MTSTASFERDYELAREQYPDEVRRLDNYRELLLTDFADTFANLRESHQLLSLDEHGRLYELIHQHRESKVGLLLDCDEQTEQVTSLAVIHGAEQPRLFIEDNARQPHPSPPDHHNGALNAKEQNPAPATCPLPREQYDSCFWGFGHDHSKARPYLRRSTA